MALVNEKLGREKPISNLADLLYSTIVDCKNPDNLVYAEAILVLRYLGNEYKKVERDEQSTVPENFIGKNEFKTLFTGSSDYWKEQNLSDIEERHPKCTSLYSTLRILTERHSSSVDQKIIDIDAVTVVMRHHAEGKPFSVIDTQRVRFRDQY